RHASTSAGSRRCWGRSKPAAAATSGCRHTRVDASVVRIPTACSGGRCGSRASRNRRFSATTVPAIVRSQTLRTTGDTTRHPFPPAGPPPVGRAYPGSAPKWHRNMAWYNLSVSLAPTSGVTAESLEELRRPLTGYCYRMLGSAECEDAVQEVFLRALRHADRYDPARASLSTWLHRIATNVCLDMLRGAKRRALSVEMAPAGTGGDIGAALPPVLFVEPMPDHRVLAQDPADVAEARESVHLAFLAALQHLPPRQRAVLLLRDVLAFSAKESAHVVQ